MSAVVGIIMGSQSDWPTLKEAAAILDELGVAYETKIVSAHRTPDRLWDYGKTAAARGLSVIIAGAAILAAGSGHRICHAVLGSDTRGLGMIPTGFPQGGYQGLLFPRAVSSARPIDADRGRLQYRVWQMGNVDLPLLRNHKGIFQSAFQFANIARPGVVHKVLQGLRR